MKKRSLGHVVGWVTVLALGTAGTAQALPGTNKVDSGDIIDGQVRRADVASNAITGAKVADGTLSGADVVDGGIGGPDLAFKAVGTDHLEDGSANADIIGTDAVRGYHVLNGSLSGLDVAQNNSLTGDHVNEQSLNLYGNCGPGTVHGWVHVETTALTTSFSTVGGYNCAGQTIQAMVSGDGSGGLYRVRFNGNPSVYAVVSMSSHTAARNETVLAYREGNDFVVRVTDASQSVLIGGGSFNLMLF